MLCGILKNNALFITRLIIPEQTSTSDTCETLNEEEFFDYCDKEELLVVGWINHDKTLFSPSKKFDDDNEKDIDKLRMKKAAEWDASFKGWAGATPERRLAIDARGVEHDALTGLVGIEGRHRRQQRLRVGMCGTREQRLGGAHFDDATEIHHRDARADVPHQAKVVGDEQVGEAQPCLQVHHQVDARPVMGRALGADPGEERVEEWRGAAHGVFVLNDRACWLTTPRPKHQA